MGKCFLVILSPDFTRPPRLFFCVYAAGQEDSGKVQPLPGRGEPEQAGGGGLVHGSPHLSAHCHPGLLLHPCVHDGVSVLSYIHTRANDAAAGVFNERRDVIDQWVDYGNDNIITIKAISCVPVS